MYILAGEGGMWKLGYFNEASLHFQMDDDLPKFWVIWSFYNEAKKVMLPLLPPNFFMIVAQIHLLHDADMSSV